MSHLTSDCLPAGFAHFDDLHLPYELPMDFAGFDEDRPPGPSAAEGSSRRAPQSCTAPGETLGCSQLLERVPGEVRSLVTSFTEILGATVTHVVPRGAPDPCFRRGAAHDWDACRRQRDDRIFARGREASGGKSFYERTQQTEEEKKRERLREGVVGSRAPNRAWMGQVGRLARRGAGRCGKVSYGARGRAE